MSNNIIELEAGSPEELQRKLEENDARKEPCFAALSIYGPGILMRQFDLPNLGQKDLINALKLEAVDIFSVAPEQVELDFAVFDTAAERVKGIFIAMPAAIIKEYRSVFSSTNCHPVKITARSIAVLGKFFSANPEAVKNNFCFLNFSRSNIIDLAVFINGECELIREIVYDNFDDAEQAVLDSLKYSYGRSVTKQLNKIYFSGDLAGREELAERLEKKIEIEPKSSYADDSSKTAQADYAQLFSGVNLLKKAACILTLRNYTVKTAQLCVVVGVVLCAVTLAAIFRDSAKIRGLKDSFSRDDYEHASLLQAELGTVRYGE